MVDIRRSLPPGLLSWPVLVPLALLLAGLGWPLVPQNGLLARYYPTARWTGEPSLVTRDRGISPEAFLDRAKLLFPNQPFSATWQGYLLIEQTGPYTFSLASDDGARVSLDGRQVLDDGGEPGSQAITATVHVEPGLRPFEVRYFDAGGDRALTLQWSFDGGALEALPPRHLFPTRTAYWIRNIGYGYLLPLALSLAILAVPVVWGARQIAAHLTGHTGDRWTNGGLLIVLASVVALALPAAGWGLPYFISWAPDELLVWDVADGVRQGFSGGWHGAYPPFHYYLLGLLLVPFELAERGGLTRVLMGHTYFTLSVMFRLVSIVMGVGTAYLAYRIAVEVHGDRVAGVFTALLLASMPLFVYYVGLANLDIPYVFWFTLAVFFYVRFVKDPKGPDLLGFAVAATLAVCTKDQAYAFFILPAGYALWLRIQSFEAPWWRFLLADRRLATAVAGALVALVVGQNLMLNAEGFLAHVGYLLDTSTYPPRHPATVSGFMQLLGEAVVQLSWAMGWPSLLVCAVGLGITCWRQPAGLALLLFVGSYYLFFIAVIRYQFDRFFLGICVVLAVGGGVVLSRLFHARRWAPARRLAGAGVVLAAACYGTYVPVAMTADSRYGVEAWLASEVSDGEVIAYVGRRTYLPRFPHGTVRVRESWPYVRRRRPDVLVVNGAYSCRARPSSSRRAFYDQLDDPENGLYKLVLAHRSDPWWPVRGPDAVFRAPCENGMTSLSRINPEIRVYRRVARS